MGFMSFELKKNPWSEYFGGQSKKYIGTIWLRFGDLLGESSWAWAELISSASSQWAQGGKLEFYINKRGSRAFLFIDNFWNSSLFINSGVAVLKIKSLRKDGKKNTCE